VIFWSQNLCLQVKFCAATPWSRTKEFLTQGVPLVGTLVFGAVVGQATTLLVSRLGTDAVAATTAVSTATVVWAGAINAMVGGCTT
jgi:Na+-driven multidrug efflux pump